MKFAADRMLGRLAKWLRILGYDTVYRKNLSDEGFISLAREGRILLTRNTSLRDRLPPEQSVFITSDHYQDQLVTVIKALSLKPVRDAFFSRCTVCNTVLEPAQDVEDEVPEYIWETQHKFSRCRNCGKVYWPGTHYERTFERIKTLFRGRGIQILYR
nr:hypothetical protein [Desulfobacterales bacterium]